MEKKSYIEKLLIYFFIFAFIGWTLETLYGFTVLGHFTKRGFLYGPICPIYGYAAIIMITFINKYKASYFKIFINSIIIFSLFEYIAGYILEALFCIRLWDYTNDFMNLNGRISIFYSIIWGIIAIIFVKFMYPFAEKIINYILDKIPKIITSITVYIIFSIYIIDTFFSFFKWN